MKYTKWLILSITEGNWWSNKYSVSRIGLNPSILLQHNIPAWDFSTSRKLRDDTWKRPRPLKLRREYKTWKPHYHKWIPNERRLNTRELTREYRLRYTAKHTCYISRQFSSGSYHTELYIWNSILGSSDSMRILLEHDTGSTASSGTSNTFTPKINYTDTSNTYTQQGIRFQLLSE